MKVKAVGIDKLCLGTVQLGTKYGINNEINRQPTEDESFQVLGAAVKAGIKYFDTASVYGNAEALLGNYGLADDGVKIISKLRPEIWVKKINANDIKNSVIAEVQQSLIRLKAKSIYAYMLHRASDMHIEGIVEGLVAAKDFGLVKKIGVSIYEPEEALEVVNDARLDIIQIPYNVLDKRLDKTDFFVKAKARGLEVHARSAFLQGLLLMKPENIPSNLTVAVPLVKMFQEIAAYYGFTPLEAAMLYSCKHNGITKVVFGVDTVEQLVANIKIAEKLDGFTECYNELYNSFTNVERKIIVPSLWNS